MNSDLRTPITIEVTVPRIVLPSLNEQSQAEDAEQGGMGQVHLLLDNSQRRRPSGDLQETAGDASTYTTRTGLFHMFRLQTVLTQKKNYLLRILHQWQDRKRGLHPIGEGKKAFRIVDELAFTLEYHNVTHSGTAPPPQTAITPGRNRLVIMLNEEGIPCAYSIDGAEG